MDAGVKNLWVLSPGFVHSKQVLADDEMAVVGRLTLTTVVWSITMKNGLMYRTPGSERDPADHISEVSQEITEDTFHFTWHQSLIKEIMQLFTPML